MDDDLIVTAYVVIDEMMQVLSHRSHCLAHLSDAGGADGGGGGGQVFRQQPGAGRWRSCTGCATWPSPSAPRASIAACTRWAAGCAWRWRPWGRSSRMGRRSCWTACPSRSAAAPVPDAAARCAGGSFAAIAPPSGRSSSAGGCTWSAPRAASRSRSTCCRGGLHDLTPIHELTYGLPEGAAVYADKAYNAGDDEAAILADTGVRLVPIRKANMRPNDWADKLALRAYRKRIETLYSQLEAMGIQRLHARTNLGLELKLHASLLAALVTNAN